MQEFSALQALCAGNSPDTGEFPAQRSVARGFGVFFDLRLINSWVNNREAGNLRRFRAHYDVTVIKSKGLRTLCHEALCSMGCQRDIIVQIHKSHNAPVPTMHHSEQVCTFLFWMVYFRIWSIVGFVNLFTNPTTHLPHIPQWTIQNKCARFCSEWCMWNMGQVPCGICGFGLFQNKCHFSFPYTAVWEVESFRNIRNYLER